jgi:acetyl esterase/lipase
VNNSCKTSWECQRDLAFLDKDRAERLDLYLPKTTSKRTLILYIHGGSFCTGDKASPRSLSICPDLAEAGYAVASVNYKLSTGTEGDDRWDAWPQNLADCRQAWAFMSEQASRWNLDEDRFVLMGSSAGATLALLLACALGQNENSPAALINLYGRVDWFRDTVPLKRHSNDSVMRRASPLHNLQENSCYVPPSLSIHGTADTVVPPSHAVLLDEHLKGRSVPHKLHLVEGAEHAFDLQPEQEDLRSHVFEFLTEYLT